MTDLKPKRHNLMANQYVYMIDRDNGQIPGMQCVIKDGRLFVCVLRGLLTTPTFIHKLPLSCSVWPFDSARLFLTVSHPGESGKPF